MKLTFRNLERDIERYLDKHGKHFTIGGYPAVRGSDEAQQHVFRAYLDNKAYDAIVDYLLTFNWEVGLNDWLWSATGVLLQDRQVGKLKRLWRGVIAKQKRMFWELYALREENPKVRSKQLPEAKALALASMGKLQEMLFELGDRRDAERLAEEMSLLDREEHKKVSSPADPRKMNEALFWEVIEKVQGQSSSVAEQVDHVISQLLAFRAAEIKRFDKLLREKMRLAYRSDLWALAYLAQQGCSDDAFGSFRAWIILQGREVYELALTDMRRVLEKVPSGLESQAGELLSAAAIAYEARSGRPRLRLDSAFSSYKERTGRKTIWKGVSLKFSGTIAIKSRL